MDDVVVNVEIGVNYKVNKCFKWKCIVIVVKVIVGEVRYGRFYVCGVKLGVFVYGDYFGGRLEGES